MIPVISDSGSPRFPHPLSANEEGLLCIGGSLKPSWLIEAYRRGIFPWFSEGDPILWWSPHERCVLFPNAVKVSKSMRRLMKQKRFICTVNRDFGKVILACAKTGRGNQEGTWITTEMIGAYKRLHKEGVAHSVEVWQDEVLVGGLYGIAIGAAFFGESMFTKVSNASKFALIHLCGWMEKHGLHFVDCQIPSEHLYSMGATRMPSTKFLTMLQKAVASRQSDKLWNQLLINGTFD